MSELPSRPSHGSIVKICLVWGVAFGLLEAAFFTRVNHSFPLGPGHLVLAMVFGLGYSVLALLAGGAAAWSTRGRGAAASTVALLAGPWLLLLFLVITIYRERINSRPGTLEGALGTLAVVAVMAGLLWIGQRLLRGRGRAVRTVVLALGLALACLGAIRLVTARQAMAGAQDVAAAQTFPTDMIDDTGLKVMLVGLDGGAWKIFDPLLAQGKMPAHAELIAGGVSADLEVPLPSYSPPLWTSIASSRTVTEHGVFDHLRTSLPLGIPTVPHQIRLCGFFTKAAGWSVRLLDRLRPFKPLFATTGDVFTRRVWDILDEFGYPCLVVDWYVTYPAWPSLGIVVSDHLHRYSGSGVAPPGLVSPDSLAPLYADLVVAPEDIGEARLFALLDAADLDASGRADLRAAYPNWFPVISKEMARDLTTAAIVHDAFPRLPDWRFAAVYYRAMDNIHHMTWHLKDLPAEDYGSHPERRFRTAVDRYYEYSDGLLADILQFADERTVVIVMSDHGFEDARYHHSRAPDGFLIMAGGPTLPALDRRRIHVYDVAPTVLALLGMPVAEDMHGRVAREMIDPSFWQKHPIRTVSTYETGDRITDDGPVMEMDDKTIEHLRALGYVD